MRKALVAVVGLTLLATVASAGTIQFFLSGSSDVTVQPTVGNPSLTTAQLAANGGKLYVWAKLADQGVNTATWPHWNGLALAVVPSGDLHSPGVTIYNTDIDTVNFSGTYRWSNGQNTNIPPDAQGRALAATSGSGQLDGIGIKPNNVAGGVDGLAFANNHKGTGATQTYDCYYLLGELPLTGTAGGVKLATFTNGGGAAGGWITQVGGSAATETVFFGTGDAAVQNRIPELFPSVATSTLDDATITPEPASLVLLALAGLALRRR